jgi:hypothetical protein
MNNSILRLLISILDKLFAFQIEDNDSTDRSALFPFRDLWGPAYRLLILSWKLQVLGGCKTPFLTIDLL